MGTPTAARPLSGIRVADFSRVVAGPYGSFLLARMGAEVIRIEDLDPIDSTRDFGPFSDDTHSLNRGGYFSALNGGKKSVTLHLSDPAQADLARQIMLSCDVVIENFPFGMMERFGLHYETLTTARPDIVMVSATGFGATPPMNTHRAFMNTVAAYIGLTALNGYEGRIQMPVGATFSDYIAGTCVALAALLAVRSARATGKGTHVDLSMAEASMALMGEAFMEYGVTGEVPQRQGNAFTKNAPCNVYPALGPDKWIAISVSSDQQWDALREAMGDPGWAKPPAFVGQPGRLTHRAELDRRIAEWTVGHDNLDLAVRLQSVGVPAVPSSDPEDLMRNPHFQARGALAVQDFPLEPGRVMPNMPWHWAGGESLDQVIPPPPVLGEHNAETLTQLTTADAETVAKIQAAALAFH